MVFKVKLCGAFALAQSLTLYHKVHLHNIQETYEHLMLAELLLNVENLDTISFVAFWINKDLHI